MYKFAIRAAVAAAAIAPLVVLGAGTAAAATAPDSVATPVARVVPDAGPVTDVPQSGFPWGWPGTYGPQRPEAGPFLGGFGGFGHFGGHGFF